MWLSIIVNIPRNIENKYINNKTMNSGKAYTIYIIGLLNKTPTLGYLLVEDEG